MSQSEISNPQIDPKEQKKKAALTVDGSTDAHKSVSLSQCQHHSDLDFIEELSAENPLRSSYNKSELSQMSVNPGPRSKDSSIRFESYNEKDTPINFNTFIGYGEDS
jgi:hypothetical protein